ncbi:hypothetical protein VC83_09323 [Pseudogymnoascus destructans]|uniref:Uncharacterized protein n=1 Tax=Pseudogymnoascus destructans TaxID=655981 RepID=A0A176ZZ91_9PEZI|nr:uncharacterized protein VC83_09323 [Pseudogymnoascus destructans]OAF54351.1 hypothetical protein VC83_09323 [Pseudogymnoascus destructans]
MPKRPANSAPTRPASNINKLIPSLPSSLAASILGEAHLPFITTVSSHSAIRVTTPPSNHQHQHSFTSSHQNPSHSLHPSTSSRLSLLSPLAIALISSTHTHTHTHAPYLG